MIDAIEETDRGPPGTSRHARTRMCAVTREVKPEAELLRFVASPEGGVVADLRAKLPGRGIWVGLERSRVTEAVRKNVFARGLKMPVKPEADLPDQVSARLRDAALGRLGLARKAGVALTGFAKVEAAVGGDKLAALLVASDAAEDGLRKMRQAVHRRFGATAPFPVFRLFDSAELGLALGRLNVIHAAVLQSPAGNSFMEAAIRLQRYDGVNDGPFDDVTDTADDPQDVMDE